MNIDTTYPLPDPKQMEFRFSPEEYFQDRLRELENLLRQEALELFDAEVLITLLFNLNPQNADSAFINIESPANNGDASEV